tara:strand:+ start:1467 stop:2207 length:741 start_codon:yes stop_codon:yes gene_type:complete
MVNAPFIHPALRKRGYGAALGAIAVISGLQPAPLCAGDANQQSAPPFLPEQLTEENFAALKTLSPFRRSLALSDSIVLTGMARIESDVFATLFDTETKDSHLVSRATNPEGWQLVGVRGDESDLESLTAKVQVEGGEVVSIRYELLPQKVTRKSPGSSSGSSSPRLSSAQYKQAREAAINYKGEHPADGFPNLPPPEMVKKLSKLSVQQREGINRQMLELRNRGLGLDERRNIYINKVDQAVGGGR